MPQIQVLDQITIDKIAAGEVIERPASIVKELVENSIDAKAASVTVEIQDGGISLIRVTDNGSGIEREDIRNAFLRHSTSKIRKVEDLAHIASLGFRGEALSSISAVTRTELITKTKEDTFGTRYVIEGGVEQSLEDAGAPDGTTFLVRQDGHRPDPHSGQYAHTQQLPQQRLLFPPDGQPSLAYSARHLYKRPVSV